MSISDLIFKIVKPIYAFFASIGSLIAFLLGGLANPQGLMNKIIIKTVDVIAAILPETPSNLKVSSVLNSVAGFMPNVGRDIVYEVASTIAAIAAISLVVKIYKLIPFKAT